MRARARVIAFLAVTAYMQAGPIIHQLLGKRAPTGTMTWRMYYRAGIDVCDAEFHVVDASGASRPVSRFEVLGHSSRFTAPRDVRRMHDRAAVEAVGQRMCRKLPSESRLFATARCGSVDGWQSAIDGAEVCTGRARR